MSDSLESRIQQCLDPGQNVMVEACAGSGKTWLLTSRIIRALLADPKLDPKDILAITFTNAACAEIGKRIDDRLNDLARADDEALDGLLDELHVEPSDEVRALARRLRDRVALARPGMLIRTFHGWFGHLEHSFPWNARATMGGRLCEHGELVLTEVWEGMLKDILDGPDDAEERVALDHLLLSHGKPGNVKVALDTMLEKRVAWEIKYGVPPQDESSIEIFLEDFEAGNAPRQIDEILASDATWEVLKRFVEIAATGNHHVAKLTAPVQLAMEDRCQETLEKIQLLDATGAPKTSVAKHFNACVAEEVLAATVRLQREIRWAMQWERLLESNQAMARLGCLYAQRYEAAKRARGEYDYADIELMALRAIRDTAVATEAVRTNPYRHILIDEFQDTSPGQWIIMNGWLRISQEADERPQVFIVGDPKQSIYGFQGGDPEVMNVAKKYLMEGGYQGKHITFNTTRRCAQKVMDVCNRLFAHGEEDFTRQVEAKPKPRAKAKEGDKAAMETQMVKLPRLDGYERHQTLRAKDLDGMVVTLQIEEQEAEEAKATEDNADQPREDKKGYRNPLVTDPPEPMRSAAAEEGRKIAQYLNEEIIGELAVEDDDKVKRPCRAADIMLLYPTRAGAADVAQALQSEGIECGTSSSKNRLQDLECRDMVALLHTVYDPGYSLALAQVLRSPVFDISEDDLNKLHELGEGEVARGFFKVKGLAGASEKLARAFKTLTKWRWFYRDNHLPVHELLAKFYQEGDILERYLDATPHGLHKRVGLNLEWLLNYSIELASGSHGQPADFAEVLEQLARLDSLPSGVTVIAPGDDMVDARTVHGAKGLESPVVVVSNSFAKTRREDTAGLLVQWGNEEEGRVPVHISYMIGKDYLSGSQQDALETNVKAREAEQHHLLYVALTRAKQVVVMSAKPSKQRTLEWYGVVELALRDLGAQDLGDRCVLGEMPRAADKGQDGGEQGPDDQEPAPPTLGDEEVGSRRPRPTPATHRGVLLHEMISLMLSGIDDHEQQGRFLGVRDNQLDELRGQATTIINSAELASLLARKKELHLEFALPGAGPAGGLVRIDCILVTTDGEVWVLDFKSAADPDEGRYREQMLGYREALVKAGWPRPRLALIGGEGMFTELES